MEYVYISYEGECYITRSVTLRAIVTHKILPGLKYWLFERHVDEQFR